MQDYLKKRTMLVALIFFLEIILLTIAFVSKNFNFWSDYIKDILIGLRVIFMLINLVIVFVSFSHISRAKVKSDVNAIDIVSKDIQDIYEFGQIGMIIVNDDNKIVWTNDWIPHSQNLLIDKDIFMVMPDLVKAKTRGEDKIQERVIVEINGKKFEADYKRTANMYILKDVSNLESIAAYQISHSPAVGIISIDNYIELSGAFDELELSDMLSSVQKAIVEYAKKYNVYLRKFRADSYLAVCTHESYQAMVDDKFSIIQSIKGIRRMDDDFNDITISIGFADGFDDFSKLSDMASSSLELALSRGGDQAVVLPYGKNYVFFGGKADAKSKRNQSRARILSQSLTAVIKGSDSIFIMGHSNADLDAIGSSLGLYCLASNYNENVKVVYDEDLTEGKTRRAFKQLFGKDLVNEITISPQEALKRVKHNSLLILTDVHRPSMCISKDLVEKVTKIAVIDHHRKTAEESVSKPIFSLIEPSASSASELVVELIRYNQQRIKMSSEIATMMLAGIILDTNYYRNKTGPITFSASLELKNYNADNKIADSFLKEDYNEYILKTKIRANSQTLYTGVVVATYNDEDPIDKSMLAAVAQETLSIQGIKACFVIGKVEENLVGVSARSDGSVNCQILMEKLGGGGHFAAAATQIKNTKVPDVFDRLKEVLDQYLNDALIDLNEKEK